MKTELPTMENSLAGLPSAQCPLCLRAAAFVPFGGPRRMHFMCSNCSEFVIDRAGVSHVAQMPLRMREQMAAAARTAGEDSLFSITITRTADAREVRGEARPLPELRAEV